MNTHYGIFHRQEVFQAGHVNTVDFFRPESDGNENNECPVSVGGKFAAVDHVAFKNYGKEEWFFQKFCLIVDMEENWESKDWLIPTYWCNPVTRKRPSSAAAGWPSLRFASLFYKEMSEELINDPSKQHQWTIVCHWWVRTATWTPGTPDRTTDLMRKWKHFV